MYKWGSENWYNNLSSEKVMKSHTPCKEEEEGPNNFPTVTGRLQWSRTLLIVFFFLNLQRSWDLKPSSQGKVYSRGVVVTSVRCDHCSPIDIASHQLSRVFRTIWLSPGFQSVANTRLKRGEHSRPVSVPESSLVDLVPLRCTVNVLLFNICLPNAENLSLCESGIRKEHSQQGAGGSRLLRAEKWIQRARSAQSGPTEGPVLRLHCPEDQLGPLARFPVRREYRSKAQALLDDLRCGRFGETRETRAVWNRRLETRTRLVCHLQVHEPFLEVDDWFVEVGHIFSPLNEAVL